MKKREKVTVTELAPDDVRKLIEDKVFARYKPVNCHDCGCTDGFARRIFQVSGVARSKYSDESVQDNLRRYFIQAHGLGGVQFRESPTGFYVDSATCPKCNSSTVVYDVDFDDDVISAIAAAVGAAPAKMKEEIEALANAIRKKEGRH